MSNDTLSDTDRYYELPNADIQITRTTNNNVIVTTTTSKETQVILLQSGQGIKLHKLLSLPGDPLPEYKGKTEYALGEEIPSDKESSPGPFLSTANRGIELSDTAGNTIQISEDGVDQVQRILNDWGLTMEADKHERRIMTLPAMITLGDGITEPLLHEDHDEILEHYHEPIGYWSPSSEEYLVQH